MGTRGHQLWTHFIVTVLCSVAATAGAGAQSITARPPFLIAALPDAPGACHVRGVIRNETGAAISGSHIKLTSADGRIISESVTGDGGEYSWDGLGGGNYILSVDADGFLPATARILLPDEGGTAVVDLTLKLLPATGSITVTASQKQIAEAEIQVEEEQRLLGIFPNFFVSYQWKAAPLSSRQKFKLALRNGSDPGNLVLVGMTAGVQQATNAFPGYGLGAAGFGRRFGADLGNLELGTFLGGAVLPSLFRQDPRYFYRGTGTVNSRIWYAASRAVVTRGDNGRTQPNWSGVLGDLSAGAISNIYYAPEDRNGARLTIINGVLGVGGDAVNGIFQEFFLRMLTTHTKGRAGDAATAPDK